MLASSISSGGTPKDANTNTVTQQQWQASTVAVPVQATGGTPRQWGLNHKAIGDSTEHHKEGTAQGPALGTELQKQTLGPVQGNGDCDKIAEAPNRTTLERSQAKDLGGTTGTQEGPQLGRHCTAQAWRGTPPTEL